MNINRPQSLAEAFIANEHMNSARRYATEGRRHAALDDKRLEALWLDAWRRCFLDPALPPLSRDLEDLSAELLLRGRDYPKHLISSSELRRMAALWAPIWQAPETQKDLRAAERKFAATWQRPRH